MRKFAVIKRPNRVGKNYIGDHVWMETSRGRKIGKLKVKVSNFGPGLCLTINGAMVRDIRIKYKKE